MFVSKPRKVALTLFCCLALVLSVSTVAQADSGVGAHVVARDHVALNRMIKKRLPDLSLPGLGTNGAAADPPSDGGSAGSSGSSSAAGASSTAASTSASASSAASDSQTSSAASATSSGDTSSSSSSAATSSQTSSGVSSTSSGTSSLSSSSSSSSSSATSSAPTATPTQTQQEQQQQQQQQQQQTQQQDDTPTTSSSGKASSPSRATVTGIITAAPESSSTSPPVVSGATSSVNKTAITVICVIAGCAAAIFIGWTIIRKVKFKPSSDFEDRMNPIDWQPSEDRDGVPGSLRRTGSAASHGSFHSSSAHDDFGRGGYGATGYGNGGTSSLQPVPDHDFTAGASSTLAPVGGYADLARGPSPAPPMAELSRGPSMNRANYDAYGVPIHHQGAYDYNSAAGARY